ncbi:PRC-barrel domain-containing protein [Allopusillimonas ginsengisoli]|uniref:PRC-barrel domain-containing protein n=1 Tax=Allopusillimonas ginsengisoli TaxID=453575 RepID=UPI0010C1DD32|nr:PRC-barrel domain containing protein [Allopusillimonas ginsengisoli]
MKKLIAIAACTMPMVFAPTLYAQDKTADTMKTDPAAASTSGSSNSAKTGNSASDVPSTGQGTGGSTGEGAAGAPAAPAPDSDSTKTPPYTAPEPAPGASAPEAAASMPMKNEKADADEQKQAISGISVKKSIMGKSVYNETDEKIGDISDVVLASDGQAAYFIVGAGGFLGLGEHNVAIPYEKIQQNGDKMVLPGFTKDQLKALPKVEVKK